MQPENDPVNDYYSSQFVTDSNTDVTFSIFKYFNYLCFPDDINDKMLFFYACKYDYPSIVEFFLKKGKIDINMTIILNWIFSDEVSFKKLNCVSKKNLNNVSN